MNMVKELIAIRKAQEVAEIVDDLATMKSLFCALSYAIAQHPDLVIEYLETFRSLVQTRDEMSPEEYERYKSDNNSVPIEALLEIPIREDFI